MKVKLCYQPKYASPCVKGQKVVCWM